MNTSTQAAGSNGVERRPALHGAAEFVSWTWEMINAGAECGWSPDGTEIVVSNPEKLQADVIPVYFRHGQYSSWVRALNAYNFKKTRPGGWHHPHFQRGRPDLLKHVTRQPRKKPDRAKAAAAASAAAASASSASTSFASTSPSHTSPMDHQDYFDEHMGPALEAHLQNRARPSNAPAPSTAPTGASATDDAQHNMGTWALLAEERSKVYWMRQQLADLEAQLQAVQEEESSQREQADKLGAFLWSELRALAPPQLHPELARLAAPYLSAQEKQAYLPLTYTEESDRAEGGEDGCKTLATLAALTTLRPHLTADPHAAAAPVAAERRPFASVAAAASTLAATTAAAAAATAAAIRRCAPPAPPPPLPPPPAQPTPAQPTPAAGEGGEGGEGGEALFSMQEIASAAGVDELLSLETEDQVLGHAGELFCELMRDNDRQGSAEEVTKFFETEAGAALRQIAREGCNDCELTAFALAKVCGEWKALSAIYQRVLGTAHPCADYAAAHQTGDATAKTKLCGAVKQTVHQISSAIEKLGHLGITHEAMVGVHHGLARAQPARQRELQAQAVADLHESLNTVELNALARDPDLLSSLPGLEQLMDSTRSSESEQLVQMAA